MKTDQNILIVGVGGQGILLSSEIFMGVAVEAGYDVKKSEVHGMAQRGGVVSSHVRIGKKIYSPLIKEGEVDIILAYEPSEALRWIHFIKENGTLIVNSRKIVPPIASMEGFAYPENPIDRLKERTKNVLTVDASTIVEELGNLRLINTFLLGMLSRLINIHQSIWENVIKNRVPKGTKSLNLKAFKIGRSQTSH